MKIRPALMNRVPLLVDAADSYEELAQKFEEQGSSWLANFGYLAAAQIDLNHPFAAMGWGGALNSQPVRSRLFQTIFRECQVGNIIETGAYRGTTTEFFAQQISGKVFTCEVSPRYFLYTQARFADNARVEVTHSDSRAFLKEIVQRDELLNGTTFVYLDAHWGDDLPLETEIEILLTGNKSIVVAIDDFEVPFDPSYEFDHYGEGKALSLELLSRFRREIPNFHFPAVPGDAEQGCRRGCVYFTPSPELDEKLCCLSGLRKADADDWAYYKL